MLRIFFSPIAPGSMKTWIITGIFFWAIRLSTTVRVRDAPSRWIKFWPLKGVARFRPNLPVGQELWTAQSTAADLARHLKEEPAAVLKRLNGDVTTAYAKFKA